MCLRHLSARAVVPLFNRTDGVNLRKHGAIPSLSIVANRSRYAKGE